MDGDQNHRFSMLCWFNRENIDTQSSAITLTVDTNLIWKLFKMSQLLNKHSVIVFLESFSLYIDQSHNFIAICFNRITYNQIRSKLNWLLQHVLTSQKTVLISQSWRCTCFDFDFDFSFFYKRYRLDFFLFDVSNKYNIIRWKMTLESEWKFDSLFFLFQIHCDLK